MMKKNIWYCHHYAGAPSLGMSYRPYYLAEAFNKAGHQATVICASQHHLLKNSRQQSDSIVSENIDGVPFVLLKTPSYQKSVARLMNMLVYSARFYLEEKKLITLAGKPDVIIVSSGHPFHYSILEKIARRLGARLIFEVRDLWPLSLIQLLKMNPFHPLVLWLSKIERRAYAHSDYVVSLLDNAFSYMQTRGLSENRFRHIPNGTSVTLFKNAKPLDSSLKKTLDGIKQQADFIIAYAGAMGVPNALTYLIQAMKLIHSQHKRIHCVLIGEGQSKNSLTQMVLEEGIRNVTFLPSIVKYQIPAFLAEADAFYLGRDDASLFQYGVSPNKLYDYMMAGKPIIDSGANGESLVEKHACGIRCKPADPPEIAQAIISLYQKTSEERIQMGKRAQSAILDHYDYSVLAKKYEALF